jgi:two-component system, OmpR family, phosphate regulon sensor histidine kinase PhoR
MPKSKIQYFPRHLFYRFVSGQLLLVIPVILSLAVAARVYIHYNRARIETVHSIPELLNVFDQAFIVYTLSLLLCFICISLWMAYKLILPLGRIIVKARTILRKESTYEDTEIPSAETEGEWSDLDLTLSKIRTDLDQKNRYLSRDQEEMEAIMSAMSDAVVSIDLQENIRFYNSQFVLFFSDKLPSKNRPTLSEIFRAHEVRNAFSTAIHTGQMRVQELSLYIRDENIPRYFSLSVTPLRQKEEGKIYGAVGIFHDLTEIRRTDQIRIDFVANVSHELRTPLTSIKGYTETLKEDLEKRDISNAPKYVETILRNSNRLIDLVSDLLNLSSLDSGAELEKSFINLRDLTERIVMQLESKRAMKDQVIHLTFQAEELYADLKRVEQVLFNLLENAIKYVPSGKNIWVSWKKDPSANIYLHVRDDGPGIPPEHHARLFERFYRVDKARSRDQGGTGLGLAIVKHIMQRHGGHIRVTGALGEGTEFICTFPTPQLKM